MTYHFKSAYLDDDGIVQLGRYHDGSRAIQLFSPTEGPLSKPTVCMSAYGEIPDEGNVFLRDDESPGMVKNLQDLGIIGPTIRTVPCGFTEAFECALLVSAEDEGVYAL